MTFGKVIFGDNQFLGVNHASPSVATASNKRFSSIEPILEVLGWAYGAGVRDFMFTTHERLIPVLQEICTSSLFPGMQYTPCLPYAHKYAETMTELGLLGVFRRHFVGSSKTRLARTIGNVALGDFPSLMHAMLQVEMLMTKGLPVKGIFLQNIFVDLLLGLRANDFLERFHRVVQEQFNATPGYITMNHPLAQGVLCDEIGLVRPWICANFNVAGFRMHPNASGVHESFANGRSYNIGMSVFASGAIAPDDAINFILEASGLDAVLFGSGNKNNIQRNVEQLTRVKK